MASWVTHLRVAELVHASTPQASLGHFLLGNIAPDAGVPEADRVHYFPSKDVSHYGGRNRRRWRSEDLRFDRESRTASSASTAAEQCLSFGYYCHLVVDNLWSHYVWRPAKRRFRDGTRSDADMVALVRRAWHAIDEEFLSRNPRWPIWSAFATATCDCRCPAPYTATMISAKAAEIRAAYRMDNVQLGYLNPVEVATFVELSARLVTEAIAIPVEEKEGLGSVLECLCRRYPFLDSDEGDAIADYARIRAGRG